MTGHLADVEARIASVQKLGVVIGAMRGIAMARVQEANAHTEAIGDYAANIGEAIADALVFLPPIQPDVLGQASEKRQSIILITAEQGFVGTYNEQVLAAAAPLLDAPHDLLLIGDRNIRLAASDNLSIRWHTAMIAHPGQAVPLATKLGDALFDILATAGTQRVSIVHAISTSTGGIEVVVRQLLPFDYARFKISKRSAPPRITLPPSQLLARLVDEYIVAELIEALVLAFAAENKARLHAMIAANDNVTETLGTLVAMARRIRQEEITEEIVELAAGHSRV